MSNDIRDMIESHRHVGVNTSIGKSIANQETADYLQLKYRPYSTVHGKNPHQPSIETAIDALQSQQKERDRINDEWFGNSLAGDKMGRREAEALAEQMRQQGKSDEEIREALFGLSDKYIPDDYNPDNFDEPWARWSAFENFAGLVEHPDSPGYVVGKYDDPKADPVVSAVRNNVRQQMGLNDTKENVGALASAGVNFYTNTNYPSKKEDSKPTEKSASDPLLEAIHQMRYGESFQKSRWEVDRARSGAAYHNGLDDARRATHEDMFGNQASNAGYELDAPEINFKEKGKVPKSDHIVEEGDRTKERLRATSNVLDDLNSGRTVGMDELKMALMGRGVPEDMVYKVVSALGDLSDDAESKWEEVSTANWKRRKILND